MSNLCSIHLPTGEVVTAVESKPVVGDVIHFTYHCIKILSVTTHKLKDKPEYYVCEGCIEPEKLLAKPVN